MIIFSLKENDQYLYDNQILVFFWYKRPSINILLHILSHALLM